MEVGDREIHNLSIRRCETVKWRCFKIYLAIFKLLH